MECELRILVLNLGSTSFKFKLYAMTLEAETLLAEGGVEKIGHEGAYRIQAEGRTLEGVRRFATHAQAVDFCLEALAQSGSLDGLEELDAVAYKAVHGGRISGARRVNAALMAEMERVSALAPAHNPVYLSVMRDLARKYPALAQVACFETAFHATQPECRALYGVPYEWAEQYGVRRYGFHGASHSYIAWKMGVQAPKLQRVISCHLGGSSSLCALRDGVSVAESMGATPQSGLFHNNRVGDLDAFCLPLLAERLGGMEAALRALSEKGGLLGISGLSHDMRDLEKAADEGHARARLALDAFADNVVGYIGMFTAYLGGLDAVVFTGGIGFNDIRFRSQVCTRLTFVRAKLDEAKNARGTEGRISAPDSGIEVWALRTNEELMVARGCAQCLRHP